MRDFHYTRPNSGVGPKEVFCQGTSSQSECAVKLNSYVEPVSTLSNDPIEHEENQHRDEDDFIETETTTHTPDVPYGKSFHVITHTKVAWADRNDPSQGSLLNVVLEIVWTGWCPFKGASCPFVLFFGIKT